MLFTVNCVGPKNFPLFITFDAEKDSNKTIRALINDIQGLIETYLGQTIMDDITMLYNGVLLKPHASVKSYLEFFTKGGSPTVLYKLAEQSKSKLIVFVDDDFFPNFFQRIKKVASETKSSVVCFTGNSEFFSRKLIPKLKPNLPVYIFTKENSKFYSRLFSVDKELQWSLVGLVRIKTSQQDGEELIEAIEQLKSSKIADEMIQVYEKNRQVGEHITLKFHCIGKGEDVSWARVQFEPSSQSRKKIKDLTNEILSDLLYHKRLKNVDELVNTEPKFFFKGEQISPDALIIDWLERFTQDYPKFIYYDNDKDSFELNRKIHDKKMIQDTKIHEEFKNLNQKFQMEDQTILLQFSNPYFHINYHPIKDSKKTFGELLDEVALNLIQKKKITEKPSNLHDIKLVYMGNYIQHDELIINWIDRLQRGPIIAIIKQTAKPEISIDWNQKTKDFEELFGLFKDGILDAEDWLICKSKYLDELQKSGKSSKDIILEGNGLFKREMISGEDFKELKTKVLKI